MPFSPRQTLPPRISLLQVAMERLQNTSLRAAVSRVYRTPSQSGPAPRFTRDPRTLPRAGLRPRSALPPHCRQLSPPGALPRLSLRPVPGGRGAQLVCLSRTHRRTENSLWHPVSEPCVFAELNPCWNTTEHRNQQSLMKTGTAYKLS